MQALIQGWNMYIEEETSWEMDFLGLQKVLINKATE